MDKKQKLIISGVTVASLLMGTTTVQATDFSIDEVKKPNIVKDHHDKDEKTDEDKKKKEEGNCGEGSCGEGSCQHLY